TGRFAGTSYCIGRVPAARKPFGANFGPDGWLRHPLRLSATSSLDRRAERRSDPLERAAERVVTGRRRWMRRRRDESGVALVEFALVLPFVVIIALGTIDLGRAYQLQNRLKNAAREGAAFAQ